MKGWCMFFFTTAIWKSISFKTRVYWRVYNLLNRLTWATLDLRWLRISRTLEDMAKWVWDRGHLVSPLYLQTLNPN